MKKGILTRTTVAKIVEALRPGILEILRQYGKKHFHLVVLDPLEPQEKLFNGPLGGPVTEYPRPYHIIAELKAELALNTGKDTGEVMTRVAHMLREGDVVYQGGVNDHGLVAAGSGGPAPIDEAIARSVTAHLNAHCQMIVKTLQERPKEAGYTIPPLAEIQQ